MIASNNPPKFVAAAEAAINEGIRKFNERRYGAAIVDFSEALRRSPGHARVLYFRSMAYMMAGDASSAWRDVQAAIRADPASEAACKLASELEPRPGPNGRAARPPRRAMKAWPWGLRRRLAMAVIMKDSGRQRSALRECEAALRLDPNSSEALELKSTLEQGLGLKSEALGSLRRAIQVEPGRLDWRLKAAGLERERGRNAAALKDSEVAVRLDPKSAAAHELKSDVEAALGLKRRSWNSLQKAMKLEAREARRHMKAAELLREMGDLRAARRNCCAALRLDPRLCRAYELKSDLESDMGLKALAWRSLQKAMKLEPRSFRLRMMAAQLLAGAGKMKAALIHCETAIGLKAALASAAGSRPHPRPSDAIGMAPVARVRHRHLSVRVRAGVVQALKSWVLRHQAELQCRGGGKFAEAMREDSWIPWPYYFHGMLLKPDGDGRSRRKTEDARRMTSVLSGRFGWLWFELELLKMQVQVGRILDSTGVASDFAGFADWKIHASLGEAYVLLGEVRKGFSEFERARALAPESRKADATVWKGRMHLWVGDFRRALAVLDEAASSGCSLAFCWRGIAKIKMGRPAEALPDLDRAIELNPWHMEACRWKAEAKRLMGDYLSWSADGFEIGSWNVPEALESLPRALVQAAGNN